MRKRFKGLRAVSLTDRKNRYFGAAVLLIISLYMIFCNFNLFRETRVESCMGTWLYNDGVIYGEPLVQRFVPSGSQLKYIEIHYTDAVCDVGTVTFTVENSRGEELYRSVIPMAELTEDCYYKYPVKLQLTRGDTYYFKVLAEGMPYWDAPKLWLSDNVKDDIRDVYFKGQPADKKLQTNTELGYAQFHYTTFVFSIIFASLSSGIILLRLDLSRKIRKWICLGLMFTVPLLMFIVVESLNGQSAFSKTIAVWLVNYLFYLLLYVAFFALTNKFRFTTLLANAVIYLMALVNYYKLEFRGEPFTLNDFAQFGTAMNVAGEYEIKLSYLVLFTSFVFMLITAVVSRCRYSVTRKSRLILAVFSLPMVALLIASLFNTDRYSASKASFMQRLGIVNNVWNQPKNFTDHGVLVAITMNAKYLTVSPPSVYSEENLANVVDDVRANYGYNMMSDAGMSERERNQTVTEDTVMPNIICIMNESYSDFSQFGEIALTQPFQPFIDSLADSDQAITGELHVSTYGGGTANSEFEFLTGNSMLGMPQGSIPYQQYIDSDTGSLARILKGYGYNTIAVHPYLASGWNRPAVYEYMDFDEFIADEHFMNAQLIRKYVTDEESFREIIELYEENERSSDAPLFVFNVTMQNHGSYTKSYENFQPDVFIETDPGRYPEAEQYLSVARRTDSAFEGLVRYFENVDEPTVICMFGDHLPSLHDNFYEDLLGVSSIADLDAERMMLLYMTDYVIWANYPISCTEIENISLNYLSTLVMQAAGLPLTTYQLFLSTMYERFPVITTIGTRARDGSYLGSTDIVTVTDIWNYYSVLMYNEVFEEGDDRLNLFFDVPAYRMDAVIEERASGSGDSGGNAEGN